MSGSETHHHCPQSGDGFRFAQPILRFAVNHFRQKLCKELNSSDGMLLLLSENRMAAACEHSMGIFRKKVPDHLVQVHPDNVTNKDWVIVLEACTIIGPSPQRLRVARATQERRIVKKRDLLLRARRYLVVEGYNPRIHTVYFCPQLYRYDPDKKLVPLLGEEVGRLIAQSVEAGVAERRPWYEPSEKLPDQRIVSNSLLKEFDTVVVEMPSARSAAPTGLIGP